MRIKWTWSSYPFTPRFIPNHDLKLIWISRSRRCRKWAQSADDGWWRLVPLVRALDGFLQVENPALNRFLHENFVLLKVFYGKEKYNRNFLSGFPLMTGTPHFYVLEADGSGTFLAD